MVPAPVVVEVSAPDVAAELRAVLVEACSRAVADGSCQEQVEDGIPAAAIAIVAQQPDGSIRIEVGQAADAPWHSRVLRFDDTEDPIEVYTAVGFAIGAIVGRLEEEAVEPSEAPVSSAPESLSVVAPVPATSPAPPVLLGSRVPRWRSGWTVGAGALLGNGRSVDSFRLGGFAEVAWLHRSGLLLGLRGTTEVTPRPKGAPQERWQSVSAGPGYRWFDREEVEWSLRTELGAEHFGARMMNPELGFAEQQRWIAISRTAAEVAPRTPGPVGPVVGVGMTLLFGTTDLQVEGESQPAPTPVRITVSIGLRHDSTRTPRARPK